MGRQSRENPGRHAQEQARQICSATERFEPALSSCNYERNTELIEPDRTGKHHD